MLSELINKKSGVIKGAALSTLLYTAGIANAQVFQVLATIPDGEIPRGSANTYGIVEAAGVSPQNINLTSNIIKLSTLVRLTRLDTDSSQGGAYQHGFLINDVRLLFHPELSSAFRIQTVGAGYHSGNQAHGVAANNKATEYTVTLTPNGVNSSGDTYLDVNVSFLVGGNAGSVTYAGDRGGSNDFTTAVIGETINRFAIYKIDNITNNGGSQNGTVHTSDFRNTKLEAAAVPEPSSTLLSGVGLGLLVLRRRRD